MLKDEPEYCAESMLAVLESLWKLRSSSPEYRKKVDRQLAKMMKP